MMFEPRMAIKKRVFLLGYMAMLAALLTCTAGCHSSNGTAVSTPPSPQAQAQSRADAVAAVQANPNLPPEQKAHIIAQMQGQALPPATGTAKP